MASTQQALERMFSKLGEFKGLAGIDRVERGVEMRQVVTWNYERGWASFDGKQWDFTVVSDDGTGPLGRTSVTVGA